MTGFVSSLRRLSSMQVAAALGDARDDSLG
jgi:hypothetical protein